MMLKAAFRTFQRLNIAEQKLFSTSNRCGNSVVFDRKIKQLHRNRVAHLPDREIYEYVLKEVGYRVADRVCDITEFFNVAVDLGAGTGHIAPHIFKENVGHLIQLDMSKEMIERSKESEEVLTTKLIADEETFCFRPNSVNLFLSSLSAHWVNDLPGLFRRCFKALDEDGAFIAAVFGGDTLFELRCSLQLAEQERIGGVGNHVSPFVQVSDIGSLMNRAGFQMLTMDSEDLVIGYPDPFALMYDLQGMAQNSAALSRSKHLRRDVAVAGAAIYREMYGNEDGSVPATFQIIYVIGWKPGPKMAQPAARGSANVSFKELEQVTKKMSKQPI